MMFPLWTLSIQVERKDVAIREQEKRWISEEWMNLNIPSKEYAHISANALSGTFF